MQQFKIKQDSFKAIQRKTIRIVLPVLIIACGAVIVIGIIANPDSIVYTLLFPIPFLAFLIFTFYRSMKRQKALLESYTLTINNNTITREQLNTPTIAISFDNIKEIVKHKTGRFTIKSNVPADTIYVPAQIDRSDELETLLNDVILILPKSQETDWQKYRGLIQLAALGFMICVFASFNKIVVAAAGICYIVLTLWNFIEVWKNKNIDSRTKRRRWTTFVAMAIVIGMMAIKLSGYLD